MSGVGYFGKLAAHGDFVQRGLAPDFVAGWDGLLQSAMLHGRAERGDGWLPGYLNGPVWRFALAPGVCGNAGVAGVLMPSVDRVGRYFPLTIAAQRLEGGMRPAALFGDHAVWFDLMQGLALRCLDAGFGVAELDALLGRAGLPLPGRPDLAHGARSLFWTGDPVRDVPSVVAGRGLPAIELMAVMLCGPAL